MRPRLPGRLGHARAPPTSPTPRRPPRRVRVRHWPGATRVDRDLVADRWRRPAPHALRAVPAVARTHKPPSGRGDAETALVNRPRRGWPRRRASQRRRRSASARRFATAGPDHPRARLPRSARVAASGSEGLRSADGSALQYRPTSARRRAARTHRRPVAGSLHETTRAEPTDCPASRRRSDQVRGCPLAPSEWRPIRLAHLNSQALQQRAPAIPVARYWAREPRKSTQPIPPSTCERQIRAHAPRRGRATVRHRLHTRAVVARRYRTAGSAPRARPGIGPVPIRHSCQMQSEALPAAVAASGGGYRASARTTDVVRRTAVPSPTARPQPGPVGTPTPAHSDTRAALSCPRRARRRPPTPGSHPRE